MVVTTHRLRVFELEPIISISSPSRPSEIGLGGDVLSSTIPTLTPCMRASSRPATVQTLRHTMPNGASGSSISPTRMVTNLASLGHCDNVRPLTPWHLRQRACDFQSAATDLTLHRAARVELAAPLCDRGRRRPAPPSGADRSNPAAI